MVSRSVVVLWNATPQRFQRFDLRSPAADVDARLTTHPWIVNKLLRLLRRRWLHLALGAGLHFVGLQGLPDDTLPTGTISTPDLPYGPVIATRYPVRSWADLRLWRNTRARRHHRYAGVVWMNHQNQLRHLATIHGCPLGIISNETPIQPGTYHFTLTWNGAALITGHPA